MNSLSAVIPPARMPQQADLPQHVLEEDASNLAVILELFAEPTAGKRVDSEPNAMNSTHRLGTSTAECLGGTVQIFFEEEGLSSNVPATRVSDGSLRYLCLLVLLSTIPIRRLVSHLH